MDRTILDAAREAILLTNCRLHLIIPSILAVGETFALRLTVFGPDDLPVEAFDRDIAFEACPQIQGLPASIRIPRSACGQWQIEGLRATSPGPVAVTAIPQGCPGKVHSNPARVLEDPPYRIYWGDLHVHTKYSNCSPWACKDPEFCYAYARDATFLDFAAAADHLRGIASAPNRWPDLQALVRQYDAPGRFVPFLGFESSHKTGFGGDINAYFLEADAPYFWLDREDMRGAGPAVTLRDLWGFLDATGQEYLTIPHHTGRAGKYRDYADPAYDPAREPLFEIYSGWGSSESRVSRFPLRGGNSDRPCYFQDALRRGCRYGVIASSDSHTSMVGGETGWRLPLGHKHLGWHHHHGLAGVRAPDLSRASLWQALRSRDCFATTYVRSLLDMRIHDIGMGQATPVERRDPLRTRREIRVEFASTEGNPVHITLLRNGEELATTLWDAGAPHTTFTDEEDLEALAIREAPFHPEPFVVYYVRAEHLQGQTQWSSPIWLDLG